MEASKVYDDFFPFSFFFSPLLHDNSSYSMCHESHGGRQFNYCKQAGPRLCLFGFSLFFPDQRQVFLKSSRACGCLMSAGGWAARKNAAKHNNAGGNRASVSNHVFKKKKKTQRNRKKSSLMMAFKEDILKEAQG